MRTATVLFAALALAACNKADTQADALDNAAAQADPAAAAAMRNQADAIRQGDSNANLSDPNGPAQAAMAKAGAAAANSTAAPDKPGFGERMLGTADNSQDVLPPNPKADTRGAQPHQAGDPVPNTTKPTATKN